MNTNTEVPFKVQITDESINLLKQKLALTTFPDELENAGRDYGVPLADIKRLVSRWNDGYDWRKHEADINELPQFKRTVEVENYGQLDVHYVHKKSRVEAAIPLLFVHGWPGSFLEVKKILPLLTESEDPSHPNFHVVALSLPGYGFSSAPKKPGFGMSQYAELCNKLMLSLGYEEYVTQGGDWGSPITQKMASTYGGRHVKAWHTNYPRGAIKSKPPTLFSSPPWTYISFLLTPYTPAEKAGLERSKWFTTRGTGYGAEQGTQPQTLGYGLTDSPAGLLAWIYEKLVNWTDNYPWEDDEVLTWVSIYWFSTAGTAASLRIYYEYMNNPSADKAGIPLGFSYFPKEIVVYPRSWWRNRYLIFEAEHESGGHFASYEKPVELVGDLHRMFGKNGPAFGVVPHKSGY